MRVDGRTTVRIKHKFLDWSIHPRTETLVVGTFNPETSKDDFFYGSGRNFLWNLLPFAFGEDSLKGKCRDEKIAFIRTKHIDFIDIISEVAVDAGSESKRADKYLDGKVIEWRDIASELAKLPSLKRVCVTRKKSLEVRKISQRIEIIEDYLQTRKISCECVVTPARYWNQRKQSEWNKFLLSE